MTKPLPKPEWPVGRVIVAVREMTDAERLAEGRDDVRGVVVLVLSDRTVLYPSRDAEGNGPGEMFGVDPERKTTMLITTGGA